MDGSKSNKGVNRMKERLQIGLIVLMVLTIALNGLVTADKLRLNREQQEAIDRLNFIADEYSAYVQQLKGEYWE